MIHRGADNRQPQRDVDGIAKALVFQYRQPLVVVHGQNSIGGGQVPGCEEGICGKGAYQVNAFMATGIHHRNNRVDFLQTEMTILSCMRIESGNHYLRLGYAKFLLQIPMENADDFPEQASQLKNASVKAIDVNYKIRGQEPVIKMLTAVPLSPPAEVMACR